MSEKSSESVVKMDIAPRESRRKARKKFRYVEQLEEPGSLYNASTWLSPTFTKGSSYN